MKKIQIKSINETIYVEGLDNGLEVYMLPKPEVNNVYVTFTTRYGGKTKDFLLQKTGEYTSMPNGIAHFLEHKMFEQEDGIDPFQFYAKMGADCNAFTSLTNTSYLFYGPDNFAANLNYLLDYVQSPYLTDENVEKEKGIIEQEIKMYEDDPYSVLDDGLRFNTFVNDPIRNSIIGTVKDIYSLNKEMLYDCYHTFYNPSNMFVVITGNFNVEEASSIIRENQQQKQFKRMKKIKLKEIVEPNHVAKEYEEKTMDVMVPKLGVSIKIPLAGLEGDLRTIKIKMSLLFNILFGTTSLFYEKAKNEGLIDFPVSIDTNNIDTHVFFGLYCDTNHPEELIKLIKETISSREISDDEIERKKNMVIATETLYYENIKYTNHVILSNLIEYNNYENDIKEIMSNITADDFRSFVNKLDLSNQSVFLIKKKD